MDKKEIKTKYKSDLIIVQECFNSFDPIGLIQGGAPIDEYDCLTTQILSRLYQNKSNREIADLIINELDQHFGTIDKSKLNENFKLKLDRFIDEIKIKISPAANTRYSQ